MMPSPLSLLLRKLIREVDLEMGYVWFTVSGWWWSIFGVITHSPNRGSHIDSKCVISNND